jgi:hypothetical protein
MTKYATLSEDQRVALQKMDNDAASLEAKLRADCTTDPNTKAAVLLLGKLLHLYIGQIGYKRFAEVLYRLWKEFK